MPSTAQTDDAARNRTEKLTNAKVKALPQPASGDYIVRDSGNRALGLAIRVYASGAKSWIVQKKLVGKPYKHVLGPFPSLNHTQAVAAALPVADQLRKQIDPKLDEKHQRAETARLQAREKLTVGVAFQKYLDRARGIDQDSSAEPHSSPVPRLSETSIRDIERAQALLSTGPLFSMPLEDLAGPHLEAELARLKAGARSSTANRGGATQAGKVMRLLRAAVNSAYKKARIVGVNPFETLAELVPNWNPSTPRDRIVASTEDDLKKWWRAVEALRSASSPQAGDSATLADYMILSLLLGGRATETLSATWDNVDLQSKTITFPATDTKNGKPLTIPYGDYAHHLLSRRYLANTKAPAPSPYVFPASRRSRDGKRTHIKSPHKAIGRVSEACGIEFSPHDLRRTFASLFNELGVNSNILEAALNHAPSGVASKHYIKRRLSKLRRHYLALEEQVLEEAGVKTAKPAARKPRKSSQTRSALARGSAFTATQATGFAAVCAAANVASDVGCGAQADR